ncbi:hypothetical protein KA005_22560, partial [bacterium]|nr:hypothetical protein [bacterium]
MLKKILLFLIIFSLCVTGEIFAAPNISSIQGTVINKGTLTISGNDFGIKTASAPLIWEDFEWGSDGDSLSNGGWSSDNFPEIDNSQKYGKGTRSSYKDLFQSNVEITEFGGAWKYFPESNEIYASYIMRWDHEGSTPSNWGMIKT